MCPPSYRPSGGVYGLRYWKTVSTEFREIITVRKNVISNGITIPGRNLIYRETVSITRSQRDSKCGVRNNHITV